RSSDSGVDVVTIATKKADQRETALTCQLYGERRRRTHGGHHRDAGHGALLHKLESGAAAHEQDRAIGGPILLDQCAYNLVHGIMPADVLAQDQQLALPAEESRGVDPAGVLEDR